LQFRFFISYHFTKLSVPAEKMTNEVTDVVLPVCVHANNCGQLVAEITWTVLTFVLYMRGALPVPYKQLEGSTHASEGPPAMISKDKRLHKMIDELHSLELAVRACAAQAPFQRAAILLGPSANSPLERYSLEFSMADPPTVASVDDVTQKQIEQATRRVVQKLIELQSKSEARPLSRTNVFLALSVTRTLGGELEARERNEEVLQTFTFRESFRWDSAPVAPDGTAMRAANLGGRGSLRVRNKPEHLLRILSKGASSAGVPVTAWSGAPIEEPGAQGGEVEERATVWLVSRRGIKGLPTGCM
jgi:hypothetical protein